ncbi:activating signal cointegrator 1 isoform X1 [Selaginella moellendorffii]|uniref:activating signal cointegrator 1 isoform X1 n=1 Tax=Selaginella moellendorffii TaxID=88036 RepID=UPI000D1CDB4B|nr:activating signal cointegrator 1 isoform X1 [Selaginella moellendorffii]|eukprot:XP_024524663.1 activating signal cointegrator 1 isoform X1 [Selaginella moellendorffii]
MADKKEVCLTMHQPWASLLVHGIKRIEGRSWSSSVRGRLWIHAAAKVPEPETIRELERFYTEVYAAQGIKDIKFPEFYPTSVLLGCVNVVDCVKLEELVSREELPQSIRMEALSECCWLCEEPQKLVIPFQMRGWQGVYNLEKKIASAAVGGLKAVQGPGPVKFSGLGVSSKSPGKAIKNT